jgi:superoxide dismutase
MTTYTITLSAAEDKALGFVAVSQNEWIQNAVKERCRLAIEEIITSLDGIPDDVKTIVRNNGGGHYNHSMFWEMMTPKKGTGNEPSRTLLDKIQHSFGDLKTFQ